tara:strand:+ start:1545 stop:2180 length:636 start_codon:yes stop_codon:yes gene_type:complete
MTTPNCSAPPHAMSCIAGKQPLVLGPKVLVSADKRSNTMVIMASPTESASTKTVPDFWVGNDPELKFKSTKALELVSYWNEKRGKRRMPSRSDVDPLDLRSHMGSLILIDVEHEPLRLRYRLIGTHITTAMARDSTGKYYDEIYPPEILAHIYDSFRWIFDHKKPLRTFGQAFYPDKNFYEYESLNMPLSDDDDVVNMVLGELIFHFAEKR